MLTTLLRQGIYSEESIWSVARGRTAGFVGVAVGVAVGVLVGVAVLIAEGGATPASHGCDESLSDPKSAVQIEPACPIPTTFHAGWSMFALWPGELSQRLNAPWA